MASGGEAKNASAAYRLSLTCSSDGVSSRMQQCVVDRISRSSILPFYHFLSSKQCFVHTVYLKTVFHMPFRTNHTHMRHLHHSCAAFAHFTALVIRLITTQRARLVLEYAHLSHFFKKKSISCRRGTLRQTASRYLRPKFIRMISSSDRSRLAFSCDGE